MYNKFTIPFKVKVLYSLRQKYPREGLQVFFIVFKNYFFEKLIVSELWTIRYFNTSIDVGMKVLPKILIIYIPREPRAVTRYYHNPGGERRVKALKRE